MSFIGIAGVFLGGFFILAGIINFIAPTKIRESYARWRYPSWFNYVTAVLEFIAGALLISPHFRFYGVIAGSAIMVAAALTILYHREFKHVAPPVVVLALLIAFGAVGASQL